MPAELDLVRDVIINCHGVLALVEPENAGQAVSIRPSY
jgi:hypothetical protein